MTIIPTLTGKTLAYNEAQSLAFRGAVVRMASAAGWLLRAARLVLRRPTEPTLSVQPAR